MNEITPHDSLAKLATRFPAASRVFMRYGLDFCCQGKRSLDEACASAGLDPAKVAGEIRAENGTGDGAGWDDRPLSELVEHIIGIYHAGLRMELPRLEAMAAKVLAVHGEKDPERLTALRDLVADITNDMFGHMEKEERILFPWILNGQGRNAGAPIRVMRMEHDRHAEHLARLAELTDHFNPPAGACTTWRALWLGLRELDADLREHIHLENNVLFPRALGGEDPRRGAES
jgi:regulator of cell morphogenesis and NO signaling